MKISHGTRIEDINDTNGYGYATVNMLNSLQRLGYEVNPNDPTADVEIWFDQPQYWKFSKGVYRIGYHPWESTLLKKDWANIMNQCDEIWTPSPIIADWYTHRAGIKVPVYVYEHGVDPIWAPKPRKLEEKFKFLHCGGEAVRKGCIDTMKALRQAFPNNKDIELNLKIISDGWKVGKINRINVINGTMTLKALIELFYANNVYVYPSYGEGFGLTPLQAMATGMPTITLPGWAPYASFLEPNLGVGSTFTKSPWPSLHPGHMLKPDFGELVEAMRYSYYNYDVVHASAQARVEEIMAYYDWDRLTKEAFQNLEIRLENS